MVNGKAFNSYYWCCRKDVPLGALADFPASLVESAGIGGISYSFNLVTAYGINLVGNTYDVNSVGNISFY